MAVEVNSLAVIFDYTQKRVDDTLRSITSLNNRLTAIAGGAGLLAKFATDVHCDRLRFCICVCLVICLSAAVLGLSARGSGDSATPRFLVENLYHKSEDECKLQIVSNWLLALDQLNDKRTWKADCLNVSYLFLLATFLIFVDAVVFCA
jgi:hypothetical protein